MKTSVLSIMVQFHSIFRKPNFCLVLILSFISVMACKSGEKDVVNSEPIDRYDLVTRHNVVIHETDPMAVMSVGNGDFAFNADVTGFQTFEDYYYTNGIPLETRTTWAWHSFPNTQHLTLEDAMTAIDFHGREIKYASLQKTPAGDYFRKNPHPVAMGQISLVDQDNKALGPDAIDKINQKLDLWTGLVTSQYTVNGEPVQVETVSDPERSLVAFKLATTLLNSGKLQPAFRFPYAYDLTKKNKPALDWSKPDQHETTVISETPNEVILQRTVDTSRYIVKIHWKGKAKWIRDAAHRFHLDCTGIDSIELVCEFLPVNTADEIQSFDETKNASASSWNDYWMNGGAVDFSGSTDPRAKELERRIILSLYLMKVNYSGSFPPQETGLANISWYGKHNSEVYWIHAAQFYQWNHTDLLEKGLQWYRKILPVAMADAKSKGFEGARWPKMSGINGRVSPGGINPFIIWNFPNPVYLSELVYRAHPDSTILNKYGDIVFESAKFLASYAWYDEATDRYILGPPIKSVNESTIENTTMNPTFELAEFYYGLKVAQDWRERLHLKRVPQWDDILNKLARPTVQDGKYVELESDPNMYNSQRHYSSAMLMALGYLPKTAMIDEDTMRNTFETIYERNGLNSFVSWSMGKGALTAARLGDAEKAVNIVCNDAPQARFYKTGYVPRPKEGRKNPAYLPVNASFLEAVGLMAAGWGEDDQDIAPGFPKDGSWTVRVENLNKLP
ncbi:hypothetical protein ACE01N_00220 [Saccharicrinis sp. FJH2]|uniref:hypothetical protein n=1 Tax=Saccharicrinis sp. FJH65 TaxID=3344659 RepID=UPI0035F4D020